MNEFEKKHNELVCRANDALSNIDPLLSAVNAEMDESEVELRMRRIERDTAHALKALSDLNLHNRLAAIVW